MTPTIPEFLRGDLPFSARPVSADAAIDNLVICKTASGHRAIFVPQIGGCDDSGQADRHLFLRNLAIFDDAGVCVHRARTQLAAPAAVHDLLRGDDGDDGDLRWAASPLGEPVDPRGSELVPVHGTALAVVELEAIALPAAAFVPTSPGPRFINVGSFIQGLGANDPHSGAWKQDAGGELYFLAPVYLPHRSTLMATEIYVADHSEADGCDVSARLDRVDRRGAVTELLRLRSRGARGRQDLVHAGVIGHRVDNNADALHIHVTWQFPPTPHQQDLRLYGARVRYMPKGPCFIGP